MDNTKIRLLSGSFIYIVKESFAHFKGLYFLYAANIVSIMLEFLALGVIGLISQQAINIPIEFLSSLSKEDLFIVLVFLFLARFSSMFILESWTVHYAKEMQVYLSSTALRKVMHENIKEIEKVEIGHYMVLAGDEASNASQVIVSLTGIINNGMLIIVYMFSLYMLSMEIFIWVFFLLGLLAITIRIIYKIIFRLGHEQALLRRKSNSNFIDAMNGIRMAKAFSIESYISDEYRANVSKYFTVNSLLSIYSFLTKYLPLIMLFLLFGAYTLFEYSSPESFGVAFLITALFMSMRLLHSIGVLAGLGSKLIGELKGIQNIVSFIRDFKLGTKEKKINSFAKTIKIEDLSFSYGNNTVFNKFNYTFVAGQSYAIYGESGVGKSTLLDLIMDFVSPDKGQVLINDINVKNIEESSLTSHVLYVGQESIIFNKSIRENIELNNEFSHDEIIDALKMVQLDEMIEQLEGGIEYVLFYKGTNISGGQRQRINLARALIRTPDVLILDEVTSALDPVTKDLVLANILEKYKNKLLIFVTHDPSILSLVDNVIDLKKMKKNYVG